MEEQVVENAEPRSPMEAERLAAEINAQMRVDMGLTEATTVGQVMEQVGVGGAIDQESADAPAPEEPFDMRQEDLRIAAGECTLEVRERLLNRRLLIRDISILSLDCYIGDAGTWSPFDSARIFTMKEAWESVPFFPNKELVFLKEPHIKTGCKLEDWFDSAFISLMKDAPGTRSLAAT